MTTTTSQAPVNGCITGPPSFDPYVFKMLRHCHLSSKASSPYSSSIATNELILQHALAQSYYNHNHNTHVSSGNVTTTHNSSNSNTLPPNVAVTKSSLDYISHYQSSLGSRNNSLSTKLPSTTSNTNSITSTNSMAKIATTNGNWEDYCTKSLKNGTTKETWDQWLQPPLGAVIQGPSCIPADKSGEKSDTTLCGERITCFIVGGEKRLCLPEILNTVLKDFSLQEINSACEKLHIYCSRCTNDQLDILKITQVLPLNAPSCGLITQTDAERLCAILLQQRFKGHLWSNQFERLYSIKVQHKCFGKCCGLLYPTLYVSPQAECIQCDTCQAIFSPKTFVSHGHKSEENRICHWGFNSDNWRSYLKIRSTEDNKAREELELFKEKFIAGKKRPLSECVTSTNPSEKRLKLLPDWSGNTAAVSNASVLFGHNLIKKGQDNSSQNKSEEYPPFGLPRPTLINPSNVHNDLIVRTTLNNDVNKIRNEKQKDIELSSPVSTPTKEYSLKVARSVSPDPICSSATSSISTTTSVSFNDFSVEGIKQVVETTVATQRSRTQLINYISQLQLTLQAKLNTALQSQVELHERQNSLQHENDNLRIKLQKLDQENFSLKHRMDQLLTLSSPPKRAHHDPSIDLYTTSAKKLSNHTVKHRHHSSKTNSPHIKDTTTSSSVTSTGSKCYSSSHSSNSNSSSPVTTAGNYSSLSSRLGLLLGTTNGHHRHEHHQDDSDSTSSSSNSSLYSPSEQQQQQSQYYKKCFCCTDALQVVETSSPPPAPLLPVPTQEEHDQLKEKETKKQQHKKLDDIVDSLKEQQKKQMEEEDQDSCENVDDDDLEEKSQELFIGESQEDIEKDKNEDEIEINVDDDIAMLEKTEHDNAITSGY